MSRKKNKSRRKRRTSTSPSRAPIPRQASAKTHVSIIEPARLPAPDDLVSKQLSSIADISWDWNRIQDFTVKTVNDVLKRRYGEGAPLVEPRRDISVPAIEAMRYSPLKYEMAYLIASTMSETSAEHAHPAYIEILKQLTADEIRIIAAMPAAEHVLPILDVNYVDRARKVHLAIRNIVPPTIAHVCQNMRAIAGYIDNLTRLNLVNTPSGFVIRETHHYTPLLDQEFVRSIGREKMLHLEPKLDRKVLSLTAFGESFRACCIDYENLPQ
jgi:hypothetical protein